MRLQWFEEGIEGSRGERCQMDNPFENLKGGARGAVVWIMSTGVSSQCMDEGWSSRREARCWSQALRDDMTKWDPKHQEREQLLPTRDTRLLEGDWLNRQ